MTTSTTTTRTATVENPPTASKQLVQEALQVTWLLNGDLKNAQIAYIRVGTRLARVRDEKLYAALKHPNMESYARERLHLGRSSMYNYLQVHDWLVACHPEWLAPKPKGFIPNLCDAADLIWIENELAKTDLDAKKRTALEELRKAAMAGELRMGMLERWRKQQGAGRPAGNGLKAFAAQLRLVRNRAAKLKGMPPEVTAHLEAALAILKNSEPLRVAGLERVCNGETGGLIS